MRRQRGTTIIEMLIAVAIIGIAVLVYGDHASVRSQQANALVLAERARLILDYHADMATRGLKVKAETRERLLAELPAATLNRQSKGPKVYALHLSWRAPNGDRDTLELHLVGGGR